MYKETEIVTVLEVGDRVAQRLSFMSDEFSRKVGTLISINPCIVEYDNKVFNVCSISNLEYRGDDN